MKKFNYLIITKLLIFCLFTSLTIESKTSTNTESMAEMQYQLIGDFGKSIIEPHIKNSSML